MEASHAAARSMLASAPLTFVAPLQSSQPRLAARRAQGARLAAARGSEQGLWLNLGQACLLPVLAAGAARRRPRVGGRKSAGLRATSVDAEAELAPWEVEDETEEERQERYKREADEMKLKWDARRLEEKQSAERRVAFAAKERERAQIYGPRDPVMEAYEARMYEEARVIEVRRRQREVYERVKASKLGRPLPPKGKEYVTLRPSPAQPARPEDFDVSGGHSGGASGDYDLNDDVEDAKYKAPESYVSPTGPAPPARHERGMPKAAWEENPYHPPSYNAKASNWPKPGSITSKEGLKIDKSAPVQKEVYKEEEEEEEDWGPPVPPPARSAAEEEVVEAEEVAEEEESGGGGGGFNEAELSKMRVSELKAKCSELGVAATGTKADLIAALMAA